MQGVARGNHLAFLRYVDVSAMPLSLVRPARAAHPARVYLQHRLDFAEVVNDADGRDAIPDELRANSSVEGMELVFDRDG